MGVIINIFKLPELRRRVLFTLAMLAVYRFGVFVAVRALRVRRAAAVRMPVQMPLAGTVLVDMKMRTLLPERAQHARAEKY